MNTTDLNISTVLCGQQLGDLERVVSIPKEDYTGESLPGLEIVPKFTIKMFINLIKDMISNEEDKITTIRDDYYVRVCDLKAWQNKCLERLSFYTVLKELVDDSMALTAKLNSPSPLIALKWSENDDFHIVILMVDIIEKSDIGGVIITRTHKDSIDHLFNNDENNKVYIYE